MLFVTVVYDDEAVQKLLDRSQEDVDPEKEKEFGMNEYLRSFKVASYQVKEGIDEVGSVLQDEPLVILITMLNVVSMSLSINTTEYGIGVELSPISCFRSVSVSQSGKCTVAKRLIGSRYCLR